MARIVELRARVIRILKYLYKADVPTRAASVSYYAMLASIPVLAVLVTVSAQLLPNIAYAHAVGIGQLTTHELNMELDRLLPAAATEIIKSEIARIQSQPPVGILSLGVLLSLWTASNAYMALMNAMNEIYGCVEIHPYWQRRLIALFMPLVFTIILLTSLVAIVSAPAVIAFLDLGAFAGAVMSAAQFFILFCVLTATFEIAYRLGPRRRIAVGIISPGAAIGAGIFLAASVLFQVYVQRFGSYDRVYGSLGGFVVFLVWIWLSNACLLAGCAVNRVLDDERLAPLRNIRELVRTLD